MIRYTTTRRIFSLLNRLLLIAKFNLGPKEMERNFILICYPLNKEKRNREEQFYSIKMINIGHEYSLIFSSLSRTKRVREYFYPYFCKNSKIFSLINAIFFRILE